MFQFSPRDAAEITKVRATTKTHRKWLEWPAVVIDRSLAVQADCCRRHCCCCCCLCRDALLLMLRWSRPHHWPACRAAASPAHISGSLPPHPPAAAAGAAAAGALWTTTEGDPHVDDDEDRMTAAERRRRNVMFAKSQRRQRDTGTQQHRDGIESLVCGYVALG